MSGTDRSTIVVAMDGPAGSGKSSTARGCARALGLRYLDTGALYRAMTWAVIHAGVDPEDDAAVAALAASPTVSVSADPDRAAVVVDGEDVTEAIRQSEVARAVSAVSRVPAVRERLVAIQREIIGDGGVVVEGRDIGTVVAPNADVKVFLVADPTIRAERRAGDLGRGSDASSIATTREAMARRDHLDSTRSNSPLAKADDAIELDTTSLTLDEAIAEVVALVESAERKVIS